jgi:hypothetical protein
MTRNVWESTFRRQLKTQLDITPEQINFRSSDVLQTKVYTRTGDRALNRNQSVASQTKGFASPANI